MYSTRKILTTLFVVSTLSVTALTIILHFFFSTENLKQQTVKQLSAFADRARERIIQNENSAARIVNIIASYPHLRDLTQRQKLIMFSDAMSDEKYIHGLYYADLNGNFFELINLNSSEVKMGYKAHTNERWLVMRVQPKTKIRKLFFFDDALRLVRKTVESTDYDATTRSWFTDAKNYVQQSAPYTFSYTQKPGMTYFKQAIDGTSVIGLDVSVSNLSGSLVEAMKNFSGDTFLLDSTGEIITDTLPIRKRLLNSVPMLNFSSQEREVLSDKKQFTVSNSVDWAPVDFAVSGEPKGFSVDLVKLIGQQLDTPPTFINGFHWSELISKFESGEIDILNAVYNNQTNRDMGLLSKPFARLPFAVISKPSKRKITGLKPLKGQRLALAKGWSITKAIADHYPEIGLIEVTDSLAVIEAVKNGVADFGIESERILKENFQKFEVKDLLIHRISEPEILPDTLHLMLQKHDHAFLKLVNRSITTLSEKELPLLDEYWLSGQHTSKGLKVFPYVDALNALNESQYGELHQLDDNGTKKLMYVDIVHAAANKKIAFIVNERELLSPIYRDTFNSVGIIILVIVMMMPLSYWYATPMVKPINKLLVMTQHIAARRYREIEAVESPISEFQALSNAMSDMAKTMNTHEKAQQKLIDSIIQLIAQAIDDKSPYTAGHCARVPDLGMKLAQYASDDNSPAFKPFKFETDDQWREFKTAAWLHDCGKITTPEHIVDKGTKLECIYNRIHEIRTRFEVLLRDAKIEYLEKCQATPEQKLTFEAEWQTRCNELMDEFEFVAQCNVGGEYLSPEKQQRLNKIGQRTWQRTLCNTIGLSPIEQQRVVKTELPTTEYLLSNKAEHIIHRQSEYQLPQHLNINMDIPEFLANQGELYNLSISRGTLSSEDRFRINEHMISTIKILDNVPFPPELSKVPRIASTHHETMRGDGYPRKLKGEELSIPERILALADVFEALTAADRPYKTAKTLTESLSILKKMVIDDHLDKDVYNLFLTTGCYLDYAHEHLSIEQITAIDIEDYLLR